MTILFPTLAWALFYFAAGPRGAMIACNLLVLARAGTLFAGSWQTGAAISRSRSPGGMPWY
jgi:hypothetical protein